MRWRDLEKREAGRKLYIVGTGPSADRPLGPHPKICMNFAPLAHQADYWIRVDETRHFDQRLKDLFARTLAAVRSSGAVSLACEEPLPGDLRFRMAFSPEYDVRKPYELINCDDNPGLPRDVGTLGAALALAAWLGPADLELVGCDFGPVGGRVHFYDEAPSCLEDLQDAARSCEQYRWMYGQMVKHHVPALAERGIRFTYPEPAWIIRMRAEQAAARASAPPPASGPGA